MTPPATSARDAGERQDALRHLLAHPLTLADGLHAEAFRLVRRHREELARDVRQLLGYRLVVEGAEYEKDKHLAENIAKSNHFSDFQIVVLHDRVEYADSVDKFLWATWTRFNPSTDIYAKEIKVVNNHISYTAPIIIDARMKPWYPKEVEAREDIAKLVDRRWREYFPEE